MNTYLFNETTSHEFETDAEAAGYAREFLKDSVKIQKWVAGKWRSQDPRSGDWEVDVYGSYGCIRISPRTSLLIQQRDGSGYVGSDKATVWAHGYASLGEVDDAISDWLVGTLNRDEVLPGTLTQSQLLLLKDWRAHRNASPDKAWRPKETWKYHTNA